MPNSIPFIHSSPVTRSKGGPATNDSKTPKTRQTRSRKFKAVAGHPSESVDGDTTMELDQAPDLGTCPFSLEGHVMFLKIVN